ncbi:MAG: OB-fold nucleic acid binding domain-containing protein, partial [Planctomycetes bacterium]|nr:OB-fold nucleic acid binding domain-containing protein [Planctomycetota bacterium]
MSEKTPNKVSIRELPEHVGEEVCLSGWLYNRRSKGKIHFLQFRDGSGRVQAVMGKGAVSEELFELCSHLPYESSV